MASTGSTTSPRRLGALGRSAMGFVLMVLSATLQGCIGQAFSHPTPAWLDYPSYWKKFQYIPPGDRASQAVYNSCSLNIPKREQCSGHGECRPWRESLQAAFGKPYEFCQCFKEWADPECRTKRSSQMVAYFISVFGGLFGFDQFYLGFYYAGFAKFATFGGLGIWWVIDIVRIGSSPVYTSEYRLAYDFPHWAYVFCTVAFFSALGYFIFAIVLKAYKREKAKKRMMLQEELALRKTLSAADHIRPEDEVGNPTYASYPVPMPHGDVNGRYPGTDVQGFSYGGPETIPTDHYVSSEVKKSGMDNPYSPWAVWKHATRGWRPNAKYDTRGRPLNPANFQMLAANAGNMMNAGYGTYGY